MLYAVYNVFQIISTYTDIYSYKYIIYNSENLLIIKGLTMGYLLVNYTRII